MKITGLDKLKRTLKQAAQAVGESEGDIGSVQLDPHDPASIEQAIASMNAMVDKQFEDAETNPLIRQLAEAMKEQYRAGILDQAAAERLKGDE